MHFVNAKLMTQLSTANMKMVGTSAANNLVKVNNNKSNSQEANFLLKRRPSVSS